MSYCKFGNFHDGFSFQKIKPSRNGEIILSFTDIIIILRSSCTSAQSDQSLMGALSIAYGPTFHQVNN